MQFLNNICDPIQFILTLHQCLRCCYVRYFVLIKVNSKHMNIWSSFNYILICWFSNKLHWKSQSSNIHNWNRFHVPLAVSQISGQLNRIVHFILYNIHSLCIPFRLFWLFCNVNIFKSSYHFTYTIYHFNDFNTSTIN